MSILNPRRVEIEQLLPKSSQIPWEDLPQQPVNCAFIVQGVLPPNQPVRAVHSLQEKKKRIYLLGISCGRNMLGCNPTSAAIFGTRRPKSAGKKNWKNLPQCKAAVLLSTERVGGRYLEKVELLVQVPDKGKNTFRFARTGQSATCPAV